MYHNNFLNDSGLETHKQVFVTLKYRFNFSLNMECDGTFSKVYRNLALQRGVE